MIIRHTVAPAFIWLALIQSAQAENFEQDVTHLERLIAEIEKLVPAGWNLELDLAAPGPGGLRPVLTITTGEKVSMKWNLPGQAFRAEGQPDKNIKQDTWSCGWHSWCIGLRRNTRPRAAVMRSVPTVGDSS